MSNRAAALLRRVEETGGRLQVDGPDLLFVPGDPDTADDLTNDLRVHKPEILALLQGIGEQEPNRDGNTLPSDWLLERCVYRDRCWGGIGALYLDLARWCASHSRPGPDSRQAFAAELQAEGFAVTTDGLVYGLLLHEDWEACCISQATPEASETPAKPTVAKRHNAGRWRA